MSLLELGIASARAGNRAEARMYLEAATFEDPENEQAFLWLSFVLDDRRLAMRCLEHVLQINPNNEQAKRGLAWLRSQGAEKGVLLPERLSDAEMSATLQSLKQPDEQVKIKAIQRLGEAGDARAVEPLMDLLISTKSKTIQTQTRAALIAIGVPSVEPALRRLMDEANVEIAIQLAAVLARVRSMAALAACREVIEQARHPAARYAMALNLTASMHGEAALGLVRDYLADASQDERVRITVLMATGQAIKAKMLDANQGMALLLETYGNLSLPLPLRSAALIALGISNQPSAVRHIIGAISNREANLRIAAVDALARFTPPQVSLLEKLARSPDQAVRKRANQILDGLHSSGLTRRERVQCSDQQGPSGAG